MMAAALVPRNAAPMDVVIFVSALLKSSNRESVLLYQKTLLVSVWRLAQRILIVMEMRNAAPMDVASLVKHQRSSRNQVLVPQYPQISLVPALKNVGMIAVVQITSSAVAMAADTPANPLNCLIPLDRPTLESHSYHQKVLALKTREETAVFSSLLHQSLSYSVSSLPL